MVLLASGRMVHGASGHGLLYPNNAKKSESLHAPRTFIAQVQDKLVLVDDRGGLNAHGAIRLIRVIRIKQFVAAGGKKPCGPLT
jgi:hypothetical protein